MDTQSIAGEIDEMIRAHGRGETVPDEVACDALTRILQSDASTPLDALAIVAFARRILTAVATVEADQPSHAMVMSLLNKASDALETATSTSAAKYEGVVWN